VRFEQVDFHYEPALPILKNLNFDIPAGQTLGIAGPTGAGKTTLIKLLLRLYDVSSGKILVDGHDLRDFDLKYLRSKIALVSQDTYLFHGSVKENIAYGRESLSEAEIIRAAQQAQLHDFVASLPKGYDTIVGERGIKLSGGQRQRLSIARAILKDAPLLILDEATSSVDSETEAAIQENLDRLVEGRTAIIIAHRLSTLRKADRILVLRQGEIVEQGRHEALLGDGGTYADLWRVQVGESV
jgi:ABC-type multidrug transport system fused ATPase/permease subunit